MKKTLITLVSIVSILSLTWCQKKPQTEVVAKPIPEYISANYDSEFHSLNLRSKGLTQMPDICSDITTWTMLNDIRAIDLWDNQITEINSDYSCLPNLQDLNLSFNQISKIENLDKLSNLGRLQLHKNNITKISWLSELKNLMILSLWYNQISKVSWLSELSNLQELELLRNQISDLSRLSDLPNLTSLKLEFNQISDINQLGFVVKLKNLKRLSIGENKLPEDKVIMLQNQINGER